MKPIHVLVVDDALVTRRMTCDALGADPAIVVTEATHGNVALQRIADSTPDVVMFDVEMADADALEMLRQLRRASPKLPVIVSASPTEHGAATTIDALLLGASDFAIRPANPGRVPLVQQQLREDLSPKIKALVPSAPAGTPAGPTLVHATTPHVAPMPVTPMPPARAVKTAPPADAIAVGASTGGPNALADLIPALPADLPAPVLIVQHLPAVFTRLLAERLAARSQMPVIEATADLDVRAGRVYLAPGGFHMTLRREGERIVIGLNQERAEHSRRPAVDVLFRSVSRVYGAGALGVVLTGGGQDGLHGADHIVRQGGRVIAQDQSTSVVDILPGLVDRAGLADRVLPLQLIADEIVRRTIGATVRRAVGD
ncbi:MAG TPA: chemotaxis-specific protein-glutamate methyltransferase CheB [Vicinamibacterales bacterium]|nr:chemotaxis-specific protein-glutamate methyltransferase CheB [Vicinamibacterales bacterium]